MLYVPASHAASPGVYEPVQYLQNPPLGAPRKSQSRTHLKALETAVVQRRHTVTHTLPKCKHALTNGTRLEANKFVKLIRSFYDAVRTVIRTGLAARQPKTQLE